MRPPPASISIRTGTVRTANSVSSCDPTRRSEDAGGAATSDGASARGGAGMNDDDRGLSPCENQAAVAGPLEVTRGRERRRFFSSVARAGAGAAATFAAGFTFGSAAFSTFADFAVVFAAGLAAAFDAAIGAAFFRAAFFGATFFGAAFFCAAFFGTAFFEAAFFGAAFFEAAFFLGAGFFGAGFFGAGFFFGATTFAAGFFEAGFLLFFVAATVFAAAFFFTLVAAFLPCTFAIRACSPGSPEKWMAQYSGDPMLCIAAAE